MNVDSESSPQDRPFDFAQGKLIEFAKTNFIILALFFAGLIFLGIGLIQILGERETQIKFQKGSDVEGVQGDALKKIKVDVEGEVLKPGVYELNSDARVQDALVAAGGLTQDANRDAINLAAKIADGQKIYVGAVGEVISASNSNLNQGSTLNSGAVSVNSASASELEELPGIGPVTAGKIIDNRPYALIEELLERKVVGKAVFEKIKDLISL